MSGHTPGPWAVHQRPTEPREYGHHVTADGLTICAVTYQLPSRIDGVVGEHERVANARLIAAAPELLQACRAAGRYIQGETYGYADDADVLGPDEVLAELDAAIAKATGEQA